MQNQNSSVTSLHHITNGYYDAVNAVCSALLVNPDFKIELQGFGFDGVGVPFMSVPGFEGIGLEQDVIRGLRSYGTQAYYVHRNILVSETVDHEREPHKVHMYSDATLPGVVGLRVSSESFSDLSENSASSFPLHKGVLISKDCEGTPSLRLASDVTQHLLQEHAGCVALMHVADICNVRWQHSRTVHVDGGYAGYPGKLMQGTETIVALETSGWPSCASEFRHRKRPGNWPRRTLINQLTEQAVYVIPCASKSKSDRDISTGEGIPDTISSGHCFEWTYSFVQVEKELMKTLQVWHVELLHCILILNNAIAQVCGLQYEKDLAIISKMALFWCLEMGVISAEKDLGDFAEEIYRIYILAAMRSFLQFLYDCVDKECMEHFFLNNCNFLEDFDGDFLSRLRLVLSELLLDKEQLQGLVESRDLACYLHETCRDLDEAQKQRFQRQVVQKAEDCVADMFADMGKLAYMTLYANLHSPRPLDSCVALHEAVQRTLQTLVRGHPHPDLVEWCSRLVSNSLANLYFVKATTVPVSKKTSVHSPRHSPCTEKGYYYQKAEELLLMSNNIDLMVGRVRLANFYLVTGRLQEAMDLLHDIISATANENETFDSGSNSISDIASGGQDGFLRSDKISCDHVRDRLLQVISDRNCILDLLFSEHEQAIVAPVIREGLRLTKSMLMGLQPTATYVLDPDLVMHFLHVLTMINILETEKRNKGAGRGRDYKTVSDNRDSKEMGTNRALDAHHKMGDIISSLKLKVIEELEKLEQLCSKDQRDMNEKRNVAYYNMVAKCYLALGLKEEAIPVLESSLQISPSPFRNPAYYTLYSLKNDTSRMMLKGGIGVAIGIGLVAAIVGLAKSRYT